MTATTAWALFWGLTLGIGLWTLAGLIPRLSRPRLAHRVAPYLADISEEARSVRARRSDGPLPVFGMMLAPLVTRLRRVIDPFLGGGAAVALRLRQAGSTLTVDAFRSRQLAWSLGAAIVVLLAVIALATLRPLSVFSSIVVVIVAAVLGFLLRGWLLQRAAAARAARMAEELPVILEFLTLSLSAGEGILDSLRRIAATSKGELAAEFGRVVAVVTSGSPLGDSLVRLSSELRLAPLTRCIDQIVGALERGTPLAEVLRAQAQDARELAKRALIESAGKKEVAMMLPLVFLILPVTILFAVFPGIFVLQLGF